MSSPPSNRLGDYVPLRHSSQLPSHQLCREIATETLNAVTGERLSRGKWEKRKRFALQWTEHPNIPRRADVSFEALVRRLLSDRAWPADYPPLPISWFDKSLSLAPRFHAPSHDKPDEALSFACQPGIAGGFPILPTIDREGVAITSLQVQLQKLILLSRTRTVVGSAGLFSVSDEWLFSLMSFLNTCVSLVDNSLFQLYYKAKYEASAMSWSFDEDRLGHPIGRRLKDKLAWVGMITGRPLDDAGHEVKALVTLKDVRNHFAHFDPPVIAFSIEDLSRWLNCASAIARLMWKVRQRMGVSLSGPLVALLLCPDVEWVANSPGKRRIPQSDRVGYASSKWPRAVE
jgi:hypothetical protein